MTLWDPSQLGSAFKIGLRAMDTAGANAGAEITQSAGSVSQWSDWSGNGHHAVQATGANQPIYSATTAALGSKPGVTFDGSDDYLTNAALNFTGQPIHIFALLRFDAYTGTIFETSTGGFGGQLGLSSSSGLYRSNGSSSGSPAINASVGPDFTNRQLVSAEAGPALAEVFVNGVSVGSATATGQLSPTATQCWIGNSSWLGAAAPMKLGELVVVQGAMTQANRQLVEGYLAWKWGIQATLPSGHPYASAAPTTGGGSTDALTASAFAAGSPALGSPTLGQKHALATAALAPSAPVLGSPSLGQIHALTPTGDATSSPNLGAPILGGPSTQTLTATAIATSSPAFGTPALGQVHGLAATGLATSAPALGSPAPGQAHVLAATGLATAAPALGTPAMGAAGQALSASDLATAIPAIGTPILGQVHQLAALNLTTGAPVLGTTQVDAPLSSYVKSRALLALGQLP